MSEISISTFKAFGTNTTPMNFGEIYTGLQQGIIDGLENGLEILYASKFMGVRPYITLTGYMETQLFIIGSVKFFDNLPEEQKSILVDGINLLTEHNRKELPKSEAMIIGKMEEEGIKITKLTDENKRVSWWLFRVCEGADSLQIDCLPFIYS